MLVISVDYAPGAAATAVAALWCMSHLEGELAARCRAHQACRLHWCKLRGTVVALDLHAQAPG
eukprot:3006036-Amphidinium_carterae.1